MLTVLLRKASGAGYYAMAGMPYEPVLQLSTPIARLSVMEGRTLAIAAYHSRLDDEFRIASTDPEERNNRQLTGSITQLLSSRRAGTHEIKGGFEYFVSTRVGGNSQTSTGYVIEAPPPIADIEQWRQTYCPIFESPSPTSALPIDPNNVLAIDGNGHAAHNGHGELN